MVFAKIFGAEPPRTNKLQLPERKAQGGMITMQCLQNVYTQTIRDKIYSYVHSTQYFGQMQSSLQISGKRKCRVLVFSFVFCCPADPLHKPQLQENSVRRQKFTDAASISHADGSDQKLSPSPLFTALWPSTGPRGPCVPLKSHLAFLRAALFS